MKVGFPRFFTSRYQQKSILLRRYVATTEIISNDASNRKIAVLIDGDNAESTLVGEFIAETGRFGKVTVKRIYAGMSLVKCCTSFSPFVLKMIPPTTFLLMSIVQIGPLHK